MAEEIKEVKWDAQRAEITRGNLEAWLAAHPRLKQSHISKALNNVSPGTLTQWLKGAYTGDVDRVTGEVENYISREREKEQYKKRGSGPVVETKNYMAIMDLARSCHLQGQIGVVYGDSSLGKTVAVKEYAGKFSDAVLIESEYGYNPKVLVKKIADAIGLGTEGNFNDLKERVLDALKDSGRLIMVDEAENLPTASLEFLRRIHDKTGVGLFYTGMPRLIYNLRGNAGQFKQLYSRVRYSYKIRSLSQGDIENILRTTDLTDEQIQKNFSILYNLGKNNIRRLLNTVEEFFRLLSIEKNGEVTEKELMTEAIKMTEV